MSNLDPRIEKNLRQTHDRLMRDGEILSKDIRQASFETFRAKFGPERLRALDGKELLQVMHTHGTKDSLVYWIEYKDDDEFAGLHFGGISGGSAHVYGIFRRRGTEQWIKGNPRSEEEITEEEAIAIAMKHRDQLLAGAELLQALPPRANGADYLALQKSMEEKAPDLVRRAWVHKYFFILFPDKLDDFHNETWQRHHIIKLLLEPPMAEGLYVAGGRFIRLAAEMGWYVDELSSTLNALNGKPKGYWRVGTRIDDQSAWEEMKAGNYVAVGWSKLGDLSAFANKGDWKAKKNSLIELLGPHYVADPRRISRDAGELLNFVSEISEDDVVLAGDGEKVLAIGRIVGPYYYDNSSTVRAPHRRPVEWISFDPWKLLEKDGPRTTVWLLKKVPNLFEIEKRSQGVPPIVSTPKDLGTLLVTKRAGAVRPRLEGIPARVQSIVERKGQAILYGPPGTGKTYWARQTACDLAAIECFGQLFSALSAEQQSVVEGSETELGLVRLCTFHPAYGYEDFLEGYRPEPGNAGQLGFHLRDGIFKRICDDARKAPDRKFILMIDEINRGDIPRIFGELLTLLEQDKRGTSVLLPLSGTRFSVPKNVYILGTMNTADRSIALLDTALRRRFGFVELMPDYKVFDDTVVEGATSLPLGLWLRALNDRVRTHLGRDGRNLQVGHAYFLHGGKPVTDIARLARILADDIIPLLEEYCYEDYSALAKILDEALVDSHRQRIKEELFKPERLDELVTVLRGLAPDMATAPEATLSEPSEESGDDESEEGVS